MSIPEPILVVYSEPPKAIATTDLRQARVDGFLASMSQHLDALVRLEVWLPVY